MKKPLAFLLAATVLSTVACGEHTSLAIEQASTERVGEIVQVAAVVECNGAGKLDCYDDDERPNRICVRADWAGADQNVIESVEVCQELRLKWQERATFTLRSSQAMREPGLQIKLTLTGRADVVDGYATPLLQNPL